MSWRTLRSLRIEQAAAQALIRRGWRLVRAGSRIAGVQVDLLMRDPQGVLTLVEVKSASILTRISPAQKKRLFRAALVLAEREPIQMVLARVYGDQVTLAPVDGLTA